MENLSILYIIFNSTNNRNIRFIHADKAVYFNESIDEKYIREMFNGNKAYRSELKTIIREFDIPSDDPKVRKSLVHTHPFSTRKQLSLSFIRILKKAKKDYKIGTFNPFRHPEFVNHILESRNSQRNVTTSEF